MSTFVIDFENEKIPELKEAMSIFVRAFLGQGYYEYDFGSAHYNYNPVTKIPRDILEDIYMNMRNSIKNPDYEVQQYPHLSDVIKDLLTKETDIDLEGKRLTSLVQSTRENFLSYCNQISAPNKDTFLIPVPNWHFWGLERYFNLNFKFKTFKAFTKEEVMEGYKKESKQKNVAGIILVNPSNPLMFEFDEEISREINKISERTGQIVVLDEVLKGTMPLKHRKSIGNYFSNATVIEGFSKRFGDSPMGTFSYRIESIDEPRNNNYNDDEEKDTSLYKKLKMCGKLTSTVIEYCSKDAIETLRERNFAFDKGLNETAPEGTKIERLSDSYLIALVTLPEKFNKSALEFEKICKGKSISVMSIPNFFPSSDREFVKEKIYEKCFRINTGQMSSEKIYDGAKILGTLIKQNTN